MHNIHSRAEAQHTQHSTAQHSAAHRNTCPLTQSSLRLVIFSLDSAIIKGRRSGVSEKNRLVVELHVCLCVQQLIDTFSDRSKHVQLNEMHI